MYKEEDIVYETDGYWVLKVVKGKGSSFTGYKIFKTGICASTMVGAIGYTGYAGLQMAIKEINRRIQQETTK